MSERLEDEMLYTYTYLYYFTFNISSMLLGLCPNRLFGGNISPSPIICSIVRPDICPVPTSSRLRARSAGHRPASVHAGESIPVPTWTRSEAGESIPVQNGIVQIRLDQVLQSQVVQVQVLRSSFAVTERPRDALCPSVVSFNSVISRAQSFIIVT